MQNLDYRRIFDPAEVDLAALPGSDQRERSDADVYVFDDQAVVLAVNAALVTGRPLLVLGPPGSGKSSLAANVARIMSVPLFTTVITGRSEARDLLWRYDAVRRLSDAQAQRPLRDEAAYSEPGVLWQAFAASPPPGAAHDTSSVVLLDEIDKAEPDLPNALLVPLGSLEFVGPDGTKVRPTAGRPLVIITSNGERELSRPFTRRCIMVSLQHPDKDHLVRVAFARFGAEHVELYAELAQLTVVTGHPSGTDVPSTAEYLDAVQACLRLGVTPDSPEWQLLSRAVLSKTGSLEVGQ